MLIALLVGVVLSSARLRSWIPVAISLIVPEPEQKEMKGRSDLHRCRGDVLLVVDEHVIAASGKLESFEYQNWSYAWLNFLDYAFGSNYAVVSSETLGKDDLSQRRLIILTNSAVASPPVAATLEKLRVFAQSGGMVILEQPGRGWRPLSGVRLADDYINTGVGSARGRQLCYENLPRGPQGGDLASFGADVADTPFCSLVKAADAVDIGVLSQGTFFDHHLLYSRSLGRGWVVSLAFSLGLQLQGLQQGAPCGPGWQVREATGMVPGLVETQDLALQHDLIDCNVPYADIFKDWLADFCSAGLGAWPRLYHLPYDYDGLLAVTHDDENLGPQAFRRLWELEEREHIRSTLFTICLDEGEGQRWHPTQLRGHEVARQACAFGLHWYRFWPFPTLQEQLGYGWRGWGGNRGPREVYSRIHFLHWGKSYAKPMRVLAAAGVALDSSYGPNCGRGYLFGTGCPFRVLDDNGLPLPLWEWPFVAQEYWFDVDEDYMRHLLVDSQVRFHQALVILLHPHKWLSQPEGEAYLTHTVREARSRHHWVANFADYQGFLWMRSQTKMTSSLHGDRLEVSLDVPQAGIALRLPGTVSEVAIDGRPACCRRLTTNGGADVLLKLPEGKSRVTCRCGH